MSLQNEKIHKVLSIMIKNRPTPRNMPVKKKSSYKLQEKEKNNRFPINNLNGIRGLNSQQQKLEGTGALPSKLNKNRPGGHGPVGWELSHKPKDHGFDPWRGHVPGLQVWPQVREHVKGNQSMSLSYIDDSLHLFHSLPLALNINFF